MAQPSRYSPERYATLQKVCPSVVHLDNCAKYSVLPKRGTTGIAHATWLLHSTSVHTMTVGTPQYIDTGRSWILPPGLQKGVLEAVPRTSPSANIAKGLVSLLMGS